MFLPETRAVPRAIRELPGWREGRLAFQGETSQLVTALLGLGPGDRVLDACAAPGGKAMHAAAMVAGQGFVAALDSRLGGARRIVAEAARLGADTVRAVVGDARHPPLAGPFEDRKSTRLNSSHTVISYAVFC